MKCLLFKLNCWYVRIAKYVLRILQGAYFPYVLNYRFVRNRASVNQGYLRVTPVIDWHHATLIYWDGGVGSSSLLLCARCNTLYQTLSHIYSAGQLLQWRLSPLYNRISDLF